jgi:hypothetical protein
MSAELTLLFLEKRIEAARLCAAISEPYATGAEPIEAETLARDFIYVAGQLEQTLNDVRKLNDSLEADRRLESGDIRHLRSRISTTVGEAARAAQDFAAQVRFFEAMNPSAAAQVKPALEKFEGVDRATREMDVSGPEPEVEEGEELAPSDDDPMGERDADPMLM